jgi:integrase
MFPLSGPALTYLKTLPRDREYVFPATRGEEDAPAVGLQHVWERIRARVDLNDVRVHDLRHSFASFAAEGGASLYVIGHALGHKSPLTTARYAHLTDDPARQVAEDVATRILRVAAIAEASGPS